MKYIKFFSLLFLVLPETVGAQILNNAILSPLVLPSANQTIVRNWDDVKVVTYHEGFFSCFDHSDFYTSPSMSISLGKYSPSLPNNYYIYDMEIVDNILFFCGIKGSVSVQNGIVGWFDLNAFIGGSFSPTILDIGSVYILTKMVAYDTPSGFKVVAVGYNSNIPQPPSYPLSHNSTIVEIDDVTGMPTCNYSIIDRSTGSQEEIHDVIYTGKTVVFVGKVKQYIDNLYHIRIMDNPASLSTSVSGNTIHYYGLSGEVNGRTYPTLMEDDGTIAITYTHEDVLTHTYETRLRVISTITPSPLNSKSQSFVLNEKYEPIDLVYSQKDETLVLLQNIKYFTDNNPQFIFLKPYYSSSYNANLTYFTLGEKYNSLDMYNKSNIVSVGDDNKTYLQVVATQNMVCPNIDEVKVMDIPNDNTCSRYEPLTWQSCPVGMLSTSAVTYTGYIDKVCEN